MWSDVMVEEEGQTVIVADCKFRRLEPDQLRHHDVYQPLAYCTAFEVARGLLDYPAHEVPIRDEVCIRRTSILVLRTTIDVGGSGDKLRDACDDLAAEMFDWSGQ